MSEAIYWGSLCQAITVACIICTVLVVAATCLFGYAWGESVFQHSSAEEVSSFKIASIISGTVLILFMATAILIPTKDYYINLARESNESCICSNPEKTDLN